MHWKISRALTPMVIATALAGGSVLSQAEELSENFYPIRPLGMGGAFTAIANDESSFWTNPAGVARARKARNRNRFFLTKFPGMAAGYNKKAKELYALTKSSDEDLAETIQESDSLGGDTPYWANASVFPAMLFDYNRNVVGGIGAFVNMTSKMMIESDTPEQTRVNYIYDTGAVKNLTFTSESNRLSFGLQARYIMRSAFEDTIATVDLADLTALKSRIDSNSNKTTGIGVDMGAMITVADFWFPTLGVAVINLPTGCKDNYLNPHSKRRETVCGTLFSGDIGNEDALSVVEPTDFRAGVSITPRFTQKIAMRLGIDAHHLAYTAGAQTYGLSGVEAQKLLHVGAELFYGNPLLRNPVSVRVGSSQGFMTFGASLNLPYFNIDYASYAVDVSSTSKPIPDRRHLVGLSLYW